MKWTQQETDYLIANKHKPIKELSRVLGRAPKQIYNKRDALGVSKPKRRPLLNQQDKDTIVSLYKTNKITDIAKQINKEYSTVYKFLRASRLLDEYNLIHSSAQELKETMDTVTNDKYELTIQEISKTLNLEPDEVINIYSEAMRKMVDYVKSNPDIADELISLMFNDEKYDSFGIIENK